MSSHWRLSLLKSDAELEATKLMLPNMTINASAGDSFFFVNIQLPHSYTLAAEERLEDYLNNELAKVSTENPTYAIKPSSVFLETFAQNSSINTGVIVPVKDAQIFGDVPVRLHITNIVIEYTKDSILPKWDIVVSDEPVSSKKCHTANRGSNKSSKLKPAICKSANRAGANVARRALYPKGWSRPNIILENIFQKCRSDNKWRSFR